MAIKIVRPCFPFWLDSVPLEVRFRYIWRHQRRHHSDAIKALLCSALQGVSPTTLRRQSRRFRRRADGARCSSGFRRHSKRAFQACWWCALQARWWRAGGARFRPRYWGTAQAPPLRCSLGSPSSAVSGEGRRWAPLGTIAGAVRRHLRAPLGHINGTTAAPLSVIEERLKQRRWGAV